jgi:hypothetical protein
MPAASRTRHDSAAPPTTTTTYTPTHTGLVSKIKKNKLAPLPEGYSEEWRDIVHL